MNRVAQIKSADKRKLKVIDIDVKLISPFMHCTAIRKKHQL